MKIVYNSKDNEKQFDYLKTGDIFKYKNDFYIKVTNYYIKNKSTYERTITKSIGSVTSCYGVCLTNGVIKEFKSDEIVTVYRNSEVIIKE